MVIGLGVEVSFTEKNIDFLWHPEVLIVVPRHPARKRIEANIYTNICICISVYRHMCV